jgi:hypothetical protein
VAVEANLDVGTTRRTHPEPPAQVGKGSLLSTSSRGRWLTANGGPERNRDRTIFTGGRAPIRWLRYSLAGVTPLVSLSKHLADIREDVWRVFSKRCGLYNKGK